MCESYYASRVSANLRQWKVRIWASGRGDGTSRTQWISEGKRTDGKYVSSLTIRGLQVGKAIISITFIQREGTKSTKLGQLLTRAIVGECIPPVVRHEQSSLDSQLLRKKLASRMISNRAGSSAL